MAALTTTYERPLLTEDLAYAEASERVHNAEDIRKIKQLLATFLPAELVEIIAHEAELWLCVMLYQHWGQSQYSSIAKMLPPPQFDAHGCLALTRKLSDMIHEKSFIIQRIKFTIVSRDQGWGGGNYTLPFEGSWTWFEAKIVRPIDPSEEASLDEQEFKKLQNCIKTDVGSGTNYYCTTVKNPYASPEGHDGIKSTDPHVTNGRGDSWTIVRNRRAKPAYCTHTVVWDRTDVFDGEVYKLGKSYKNG
ncbi:hypothetical protein CVT24_007645 [Panaeolus cyanescens]|uniref:Uncharacterized protein n=1 Tax=Panaeolus cyanescens TaxID=181874 RepID=A0A409W4R8_9AGAR|nr:hypothetical protein CVT24_007645 [Panaeolus cyanescens]